ncbi:MAG: 16S rRNA (guanine(966)-N(2))-methyltransferase RsmD [Polyangiales bacterium]
MRIVGGALRGRRFDGPKGNATRPTADRVREAMASALKSRGAIEGAVVLDLFAGTGALAFEALSRGAARAVLVERDARVHKALKQSAESLGLRDRARLIRADVYRHPKRAITGGPFDLVFIDPPYDRVVELGPVFAALVEVCSDDAIIVVEQARNDAFDFEGDPSLSPTNTYEYGDTLVTFATVCKHAGARP